MNMKEYESAMESYDSDDIVLGDIDHDNEAHASDMDILLEALDMLPEAEFTAAMESMTDDEYAAVCAKKKKECNTPEFRKTCSEAQRK